MWFLAVCTQTKQVLVLELDRINEETENGQKVKISLSWIILFILFIDVSEK